MSRSAAAAAAAPQHARKVRRSHGPPVARRVSGPAYDERRLDPRPRLAPSPRPLRAVAGGGAAIAARAAGLALGVSGSRAMDRLVRSRGWIVIVGLCLIGIVAMQVSLLKLNAGIGRAVEATATLERSNSALRLDVSQLSATDRVQRLAAAKGFVMPAPGDVHYLRAGDLESDGRRAARNIRAPGSGDGAQALGAALPAAPQPESAVVASALAATTATTAPPGAGQGGTADTAAAPTPATAAGSATAPTAATATPATTAGPPQPAPAAGSATTSSGAPATSPGGIVPSSPATATGP